MKMAVLDMEEEMFFKTVLVQVFCIKLENIRKFNLSGKCDSYLYIMILNECMCKDRK